MSKFKKAHSWAEEVACKYLRNQIRARLKSYVGNSVGIPIVGTTLAWGFYILGLAVDVIIPVAALGVTGATILGLPVALLLLVGLFTASCESQEI